MEVRELGLRDILAVAAGVVIDIFIWFVVLKGGEQAMLNALADTLAVRGAVDQASEALKKTLSD